MGFDFVSGHNWGRRFTEEYTDKNFVKSFCQKPIFKKSYNSSNLNLKIRIPGGGVAQVSDVASWPLVIFLSYIETWQAKEGVLKENPCRFFHTTE